MPLSFTSTLTFQLLHAEQQAFFLTAKKQHHHLFLTGTGYTGKTHIAKLLCQKELYYVYYTAKYNGSKYSQIIPFLYMIENQPEIQKNTQTIILDHVEYLNAEQFNQIIACIKQYNTHVRFIFIGDFTQYDPRKLQGNKGISKLFAFESAAWEDINPTPYTFTLRHQKQDKNISTFLSRSRTHQPLTTNIDKINEVCFYAYQYELKKSFDITLTHSLNQMQMINKRHLDLLPGKTYHYFAEVKHHYTDLPIPTKLSLKIGSRVLLLTTQHYLASGFVKQLKNNQILVTLDTGEDIKVTKQRWVQWRFAQSKQKLPQHLLPQIIQFPLIPADAINYTYFNTEQQAINNVFIDLSGDNNQGEMLYHVLKQLTSLSQIILSRPITKDDCLVANLATYFCLKIKDNSKILNTKTKNSLDLKME